MAADGGAGRFPLVFGLNTFGDTTSDDGGHRVSHAQAIRDVVEEGVLRRAGRGRLLRDRRAPHRRHAAVGG